MSYQANGVTVNVTIDFSSGASFGYSFIVGDPVHGVIGQNVLADAASNVVDVSSQVGKVSIKGGYNLFQDQFQAATAKIRIYDQTGNWNPQNVSSPYYPNLVPMRKIRVSASYAGNTYYLFSGYITGYNYTYPTDQVIAYLDIDASDGFRLMQLANVTTLAGTPSGQDTGSRINAILDDIGWPNSLRQIMTGGSESLCQADPATTRTALQAIKNVEFVEQGAFYMNGEGDAVFRSRAYISATSGANPTYFNNNGTTGINYSKVSFALDDKLIINDAIVQNIGGTQQEAYVQSSIDKYFQHSISQNNLVGLTDSDALNIALNYVATRADTTLRIDAITLNLSTLNYAAGITAALALDYFNTMDITNYGVDGTVTHKVLQCMGMNYDITPNAFLTTFTTSEPIVGSFILDSSIYGVIGDPAGYSILGY
jgi:hypothetical protein